MSGKTISIPAAEGGAFDCYLALPRAREPVPAIVLACAIVGVDEDLRAIADAFASNGYIAAAPDLFWRTTPGPLTHADARTRPRGQPRLQKIKTGEADLKDTLAHLNTLPQFNGRAAVIGFCYGGPYAILGPKRLGYSAGISCHGTQLLDYLADIEDVTQPVCIVWGDQDHVAPPPVLDAYRTVAGRMPNVKVKIFSGVQHGYMMKSTPAFDRTAYDFSMSRALGILCELKQI